MAPHLNTQAARGGIQRIPARLPARSLAPADDPVALARVRQIEQQMQFEAEDREARRACENAESAAWIAAMALQSASILLTVTPQDDQGQLSCTPQAQLFFSLFLLVLQKQLVRIYKGPNADYNLFEIYKLLFDTAFDSIDDTYESVMIPTSKVY